MTTAPATQAPTHPPAEIYLVTLKVPPGGDAIRLLRAALKSLLRRFGLRCLRIEQVTAGGERP